MNRDKASLHLREATRPLHERVEAAFARFDLTRPDGYAAFLAAQARAFLGLEAILDTGELARHLPDWPSRRRSAALIADLAEFGIAPPDALPAPALEGLPAQFGAAYVLEGSRLGGRILLRMVEEHGDDVSRRATRFLSPERSVESEHAANGAPSWPRFRDMMDAIIVSDDDRAATLRGATAAFGIFEAAAA